MTNWQHTIKLTGIIHNDELTFIEKRDAIVKKLKASSWYRRSDEDDELRETVEELSETTTIFDFDLVWSAIYDMADADKVWIATV